MLALLVVPVVEVYIIIKVGQSIGGWKTFAILLAWSALGAWIVKREFRRAFGALRQAFASGRMPAHELSDAALVLIGGTLLLAPGFLTDALGLFFLLPFTRPITRRLLEGAVVARLFGARTPMAGPLGAAGIFVDSATRRPYPTSESFTSERVHESSTPRTSHASASRESSTGRRDVIEGEIID